METEVDPKILAVINEGRLSGPRLTPVEIVARMGVFDAREKAYDAAWLATGDNVIATVWAEQVSVAADGHWFTLESLDTQRRPDGSARSASQVQRAIDRQALLKQTFKDGKTFRAVLQTNRVAIAELETNRSAKVSTRVRDAEEWHVARWDTPLQLAVLVRGARGWEPTVAEVDAARARCGIAPPVPADDPSNNASTEAIDAAAVAYVTKHFRGYGYKAEPAGEGNGYAIEVSNAKGATLLKVAIKGTTPKAPNFSLSAEEWACSKREPLWKLLVVTDAMGPGAQHKIYKPTEVEQAEGFTP